MKATFKQVNDAHALLKAIALIHSSQTIQNIYGEAMQTLYSALQEIEIEKDTAEIAKYAHKNGMTLTIITSKTLNYNNMYTKEQVQREAKRLFNEFCFSIRIEEDESGYFTNVKYAKDCAYIAIDEIIKQLDLVDACEQRDYWINVQYELDNMDL